jgi:phosphate transport system permease protein
MAFGIFWLLWILSRLLCELGFGGAVADALHADDAAARAGDGGLANAIFGSVLMVGWRRSSARRSASSPASTSPSTGSAAGSPRDALHQRHPAVGAVDRDRPVRLHGLRRAGRSTSPAGPASIALALIVIPVVVRTTENMLRSCPNSLREAASRSARRCGRSSLMVTLKAVRAGVVTGVLLAVARISGETAPLLFTALNNQFWSTDMNAPMANLPVVIFQFAMSPYETGSSSPGAARS